MSLYKIEAEKKLVILNVHKALLTPFTCNPAGKKQLFTLLIQLFHTRQKQKHTKDTGDHRLYLSLEHFSNVFTYYASFLRT